MTQIGFVGLGNMGGRITAISAIGEVATRDFIRSELRDLLDEISPDGSARRAGAPSESEPA